MTTEVTRAIDTLTRAPYMTRTNTSLPNSSVPNRCASVGRPRKSIVILVGDVCTTSGTTMAGTIVTSSNTVPRRVEGRRRNFRSDPGGAMTP